jgi:hypothetical protein
LAEAQIIYSVLFMSHVEHLVCDAHGFCGNRGGTRYDTVRPLVEGLADRGGRAAVGHCPSRRAELGCVTGWRDYLGRHATKATRRGLRLGDIREA